MLSSGQHDDVPCADFSKNLSSVATRLQPVKSRANPVLNPTAAMPSMQTLEMYVFTQDMGHCVRCLASLNHRLWVGLADGRMRVLGEKTAGSPGTVQVMTLHDYRPQRLVTSDVSQQVFLQCL